MAAFGMWLSLGTFLCYFTGVVIEALDMFLREQKTGCIEMGALHGCPSIKGLLTCPVNLGFNN
jgi:hypothetical protein